MLTRKQRELLVYIDQVIKTTGCSPSFEEMKEALKLRSKSGIHRLISALEERGFLIRRHHRARALEVIRVPGDLATLAPPIPSGLAETGKQAAPSPSFAPNVIRGDFTPRLSGVKTAQDAPAIELPLYGRIAAGLPIEAVQREFPETIGVPGALVGPGEHFAVEVAGDSMVEAGILDGDTVIIRRSDTADNGQIVVAVVDEDEVTLKRLRRRGNSIALEPANERHETRIFPADRVRVQGRLVALMRSY